MKFIRRMIVPVIGALAFGLGMTSGQAQLATDSGSSSRGMRLEALQSVPLDQLTPETRADAQRVLESASIFRRMPTTTIECDPDLYLFAVRYPEVLVDVWRLMGISTMTLTRKGPYTLACNDGAGTVSEIELIYGTPTVHVFLGRGRYTGSRLVKQLDGSCLMVLRTQYLRNAEGRPAASSTLDVFVDIENNPAEWVARIVAPIFGSAADHNFVESLRFVEKLSDTASRNGPGVMGMSKRLTGVHPEVRARFAQIAGLIYERALSWESTNNDQSSPPLRQIEYRSSRPSDPAFGSR